jgi:AcrR family transcriptional regulator
MSIDETKRQIITTASQLFAKYGYYKTSIDNVAKMSRRAKGSIYYHFNTKEELFTAVVSSEIEVVKDGLTMNVLNQVMPADEKLKQFLIQRMSLLYNAKNYHETLQADFYSEFVFLQNLRKEWEEWVKLQIRFIVEQGINEGIFEEIPQLDVMLDILSMVSRGLEIPFFLQNKYEELNPYFDGMLTIIIKGLKK